MYLSDKGDVKNIKGAFAAIAAVNFSFKDTSAFARLIEVESNASVAAGSYANQSVCCNFRVEKFHDGKKDVLVQRCCTSSSKNCHADV